MKKLLKNWISLSQFLIPQKKELVFRSNPSYSDNSYAFFKYCNDMLNGYELTWLVGTENEARRIRSQVETKKNNVNIFLEDSLKGIRSYLRSQYIFETHGSLSWFKDYREKKICLWHGMPTKRIGNLDSRNERKISLECKVFVSTSKLFSKFIHEALGVAEEKVIISGQPRNDLLYQSSGFLKKKGIDEDAFEKKIMWMPTFRKAYTNEAWGNDGDIKEKFIGILPIKKIDELNDRLSKESILLIIKFHPMDVLQESIVEDRSNIIFLKNVDLEKINEHLYPLIGACDALMTDFSSVWVDFEILGKPIYFVTDDYDAYKKKRGLIFEDFLEISPLPIIKTFEELEDVIEDVYKSHSLKVTRRYNLYKDNRSCERLAKYLGLVRT